MPKPKTKRQMDQEISDYCKANPRTRTESEKQIHPEVFACKDRHGKILGTSRSVRGAMLHAPNDRSYAIVRGEFTSDGSNWGVGGGKQHAVRENGHDWLVG